MTADGEKAVYRESIAYSEMNLFITDADMSESCGNQMSNKKWKSE